MFQPDRTFEFVRIALVVAVAAGLGLSSLACSVPVFRYALEHWASDPYHAVVFHRGPLAGAQQALVRELGPDGQAGKVRANLSVRTIDLDQPSAPEEIEFWRRLGVEALPWLVVRFPAGTRIPSNVWSGPLTQAAVKQVLDSPARREIARRLGEGQTAVWLFLESGRREKDEPAVELLKSRLAYLATVLELPKLEAQDIANGLVSVGPEDLRLEFSILRLGRQQEDEKAFVQMLLGTEADLAETGEPMVFPIFGRGRALYALVGKGINHETIDEAASFLIGKCSCQVKEQNPGVDLLMAADWEGILKSQQAPTRNLPSAAEVAAAAPETVTISGHEDSAASSKPAKPGRNGRVFTPPLIGFMALASVLAACLFFFARK